MNELAPYLRVPKRPALPIWGAVFFFVAIFFAAAFQFHKAHQQTQASSVALANLRFAEEEKRRPSSAKEQEDLKKWGMVVQERAFDWSIVFESIESTVTPNIGLLEFTPDKLAGTLQIKGQARDQEALGQYVSALSKVNALRRVHVVREYTSEDTNLLTISFEIKASIRGTAPARGQVSRK
jgi:hypothetical protein